MSKSIIRHPFIRRAEGGCLTAGFQVFQTGITIADWGGQVGMRAKHLEVSLDQAAEGGMVHSITMQSLGSTPLLPLINTALQWKIHLAVFAVCFRKQAVPCLCSHWHALFMLQLFSVCLLLMQHSIYLKVLSYQLIVSTVVCRRACVVELRPLGRFFSQAITQTVGLIHQLTKMFIWYWPS